MAAAVRRARKRLEGLGSEPWGTKPQICLVDPFPDPDHPGQVVTSGTIVDAPHNEIWMVVTSEAPAEAPDRPLALLFGAALPAAADLGTLLEGYGLHVAGTADPDEQLRGVELPTLGAAEGELASAMALSFVRHLLAKGGEESFRRLLADARPGRLDAEAQEIYGFGLTALEEAWRMKLAEGPPTVKAGQFLRLSVRYLRPHLRREAEMAVYMLFGLGLHGRLPVRLPAPARHRHPQRAPVGGHDDPGRAGRRLPRFDARQPAPVVPERLRQQLRGP